MRFNSKSPPKGRACADSRRNFWTTNLKTPVQLDPQEVEVVDFWKPQIIRLMVIMPNMYNHNIIVHISMNVISRGQALH